jgi:cystathionine gamma-synthase
MNNSGLSTRCVHAGESADAHGSPHTPVYNTTTFAFRSTKDLLDVVDGRKPGSLYTRYGMNPTIQSLEAKLAALEQAEKALVFSSGMAAEASVFLSLGQKGIVCIGEAYGGTLDLLGTQLKEIGIPVTFLAGRNLGRLETILNEGSLVFFETPANPTLEVFDIHDIAERARKKGALTCVDSTFASPVNQNPLALGADLVVHSATKYLGGHSDITAGAVMGPAALLDRISPWRKNLGQMLAPETSALLARSLRTLVLRVRHQNSSALQIALAMQKHPLIKKVYYPGLTEFEGHSIAARQMSGFGGMMTLELRADGQPAEAFVDRLRLFKIAPSLGGGESLVTQPVTTTHHGLSEAELGSRNITRSMVRLSIGFEDTADLLTDLMHSLG